MNNPPGATLSFDFDELPPDGRECFVCRQPITGDKAYYPYLQVMNPQDVTYLWPWCPECYGEKD